MVAGTWWSSSLRKSMSIQLSRPVRGPKDHKNISILQLMLCGIPLVLVLRTGTRLDAPSVYVGFGAP